MYERLGGMPFSSSLTERFYQGVATDEVLRPMYPEDFNDRATTCACSWLSFGEGRAPTTTSVAAPASAARHLPFKIDRDARDRWLGHMRAAVEEARLGALEKAQLLNYFEAAANHMSQQPRRLNS